MQDVISPDEAVPETAQEEKDAAPLCANELDRPLTESLSAHQEEAQLPLPIISPLSSEVSPIPQTFHAVRSQLRPT